VIGRMGRTSAENGVPQPVWTWAALTASGRAIRSVTRVQEIADTLSDTLRSGVGRMMEIRLEGVRGARVVQTHAGPFGSPDELQGAVVVLHDVTVIDGTGAPPRPHQVVVIEGERVAAVGPVDAVDVPPGTTVLPLPGRFVVPGFVDHASQDLDPGIPRVSNWDELLALLGIG